MKQDSQKCSCQTIAKKAIFGWNDTTCELRPTGRFLRSEERKLEILEILQCECGKQVGERIYSSDRLIGCWRLYEHCQAGKKLIERGLSFEQKLGKSILEGYSALKEAESNIQEQFEREMTKMSLSARSPRRTK